ncbi:MAG: DUF2169 domain-containing protein [Polyangiaceae bacterium]
MEILGSPPFTAATLIWQGPGRQWNLTVVCKSTFALVPGRCPLAAEAEPIHAEEQHWEDDPTRSLSAPRDLVPFKLRAEVILVGSAFAPRSQEVTSLVARLRVGSVDKSIEVVGARTITSAGTLRQGAPWQSMPLLYERAAGGPGTWNPVGVPAGFVDRHGRRSLPNLQPVGFDLATGDPPPIGFGPISEDWAIRSDRLGDAKEAMRGAFHERPLPRGLDARFFQSALADQTLADLDRAPTLRLDGLHPDAPSLTTELERVDPQVTLELEGRSPREVPVRADTLWIDTERGLATLTFRGHVHLERRDAPGVVRITTDVPRPPPVSVRAAPAVDFAFHHTETDAAALTPDLSRFEEALPFRREAPPPVLGRDVRLETIVLPAASLPAKTLGQTLGHAGSSPARPPALEKEPAEVGRAAPSAPLDVLWFDPKAIEAIRAQPSWEPFVRDPKIEPLDDEARVAAATARAERATIAAVLTRAEPTIAVEDCLFAAVTEDGALESPLVVVAGELELQLDEIETLKTWVATAPVLAPSDKRLKEVVDLAKETLGTPLGGDPEIAASFLVRLREAWSKAPKQLANGYIDAHARRLLLADRRYQRRAFQDAEWLRALLSIDTGGKGNEPIVLPAYLPASIAKTLPLMTRISARLLAHVTPRQDDSESASAALRVVALGRPVFGP